MVFVGWLNSADITIPTEQEEEFDDLLNKYQMTYTSWFRNTDIVKKYGGKRKTIYNGVCSSKQSTASSNDFINFYKELSASKIFAMIREIQSIDKMIKEEKT